MSPRLQGWRPFTASGANAGVSFAGARTALARSKSLERRIAKVRNREVATICDTREYPSPAILQRCPTCGSNWNQTLYFDKRCGKGCATSPFLNLFLSFFLGPTY